MITDNTTSAVQQYVENMSLGAITEPLNGSWIQALCFFYGVTEPVNNSWMQALCNYYGITEPLHSSWVIALADYHSITNPVGGTWWMALAILATPPSPGDLVWNTTTTLWENETTEWDQGAPTPPATKTYSFELFDSYGDGWNGNIFALQQEVSPGVWADNTPTFYNFSDGDIAPNPTPLYGQQVNTLTLTNGGGVAKTAQIDLTVGLNTRTVCVQAGSYPSEPSYKIYDGAVLVAELQPSLPGEWVLFEEQTAFIA